MIQGFEKIVEERIRKAQNKGEFENLVGSGKPLKFNSDLFVPEELRMAYKILKNADCVPPEIELKKEIKQTEDLLAGMQETSEKYRIFSTILKWADKIRKLRIRANADTPQDSKIAVNFGAEGIGLCRTEHMFFQS